MPGYRSYRQMSTADQWSEYPSPLHKHGKGKFAYLHKMTSSRIDFKPMNSRWVGLLKMSVEIDARLVM